MSTVESPRDIYGLVKPRLRGAVHAWAVAPFVVAGLFLTALTPSREGRLAVAVYTIAVGGMLASSASYHRLRVSPSVLAWLRRLDHSMIGVAVAGTYTPVIALVLHGAIAVALMTALWLGAIGGMVLSLGWHNSPRWLRASVYIGLGWAGAAVTPWIWQRAGVMAFGFVVLGALLYTAGAVVYARRRPDPRPDTFGFHELFHTFVVLAVASHFVAIAVVVAQTTPALTS